MDREKILQLADALETAKETKEHKLGFNMSYFAFHDEGMEDYEDKTGHHCKTVACIAGWATCLFTDLIPIKNGEYDLSNISDDEVAREAAHALDLTFDQRDVLFMEDCSGHEEVDNKKAAKVLRHFADTGRVDWSIVGINVDDYDFD